ncbi:hypothetical protein ASF84_23370 [Pseudomonas sp. Leaf127]|uniref:DUF5713 family protein n=1 Tax=Pseudomonas sp. Leaf127 TaxID=1736267 RepID=UPI0007030233|nr:DUF5713 family protein [Pseudomonas sp. Leaf127]KQQ49246.1 hypothetical protein ASF84_23370 [Pseudomonas sp. Leaf127]
MSLDNPTMDDHVFLQGMYADDYFPDEVVDLCKDVLIDLCRQIEQQQPATLEALYVLSHAATERLNALQDTFEAHGSELETAARDALAEDFSWIASAYGFAEADLEEMMAPREW